MMGHRADSAQPLHHHGYFPVGTSLNKFFKAPKLDNVQAHLLHAVLCVDQNGDLAMPFNPGNRIDGDATQVGVLAVSRLMAVNQS